MLRALQIPITQAIPVAMLHHVSDRKDWDSLQPFVISRETFSRFLDVIENGHYKPITFQQLRKDSRGRGAKEIIISFDNKYLKCQNV